MFTMILICNSKVKSKSSIIHILLLRKEGMKYAPISLPLIKTNFSKKSYSYDNKQNFLP